MASILLVEEGPGVGRQLTSLLTAAGHRVLRCGGGPTPLAACPLLRHGRCPLPDAAQLLVFACPLGLPLRGRSYRGIQLLRAYRAHPNYGRLPLVLVAVAAPQDLEGRGSTELVDRFTDSTAVLAAVNRLLQPPGHPPVHSSLVTTTPPSGEGRVAGDRQQHPRSRQAPLRPHPKGEGMAPTLEPSAHRGVST